MVSNQHVFGLKGSLLPFPPRTSLMKILCNLASRTANAFSRIAPILALIATIFARIHRANLINFGIIPFTFCNEEDYDTIDELDELTITNLKSLAEHTPVEVMNITKNKSFQV